MIFKKECKAMFLMSALMKTLQSRLELMNNSVSWIVFKETGSVPDFYWKLPYRQMCKCTLVQSNKSMHVEVVFLFLLLLFFCFSLYFASCEKQRKKHLKCNWSYISLRIQPPLIRFRYYVQNATTDVCDSPPEIPYWWCKSAGFKMA